MRRHTTKTRFFGVTRLSPPIRTAILSELSVGDRRRSRAGPMCRLPSGASEAEARLRCEVMRWMHSPNGISYAKAAAGEDRGQALEILQRVHGRPAPAACIARDADRHLMALLGNADRDQRDRRDGWPSWPFSSALWSRRTTIGTRDPVMGTRNAIRGQRARPAPYSLAYLGKRKVTVARKPQSAPPSGPSTNLVPPSWKLMGCSPTVTSLLTAPMIGTLHCSSFQS